MHRRPGFLLAGLFSLGLAGCTGDDNGEDSGLSVDVCVGSETCSGTWEILNEGDLEELSLCDSIVGALLIEDQDWLTGINLPCLASVEGELTIEDNDALTSLDGLSGLTSVVGGMTIEDNGDLTSIEGLTNLTSFEGRLTIRGNSGLRSIEGLSGFTSAPDLELRLIGMGLSNLDSLAGLVSIGGLSLLDNTTWSLEGLEGLTSVTEDFRIGVTDDYNENLVNDHVRSLESLSGLETVGGILELDEMPDLTTFEGLSSLTTVGELFVASTGVYGLEGLESLTTVEQDLVFSGNDYICDYEVEDWAETLDVGGEVHTWGNGDAFNFCD